MTLVKICGMTRAEDVAHAAETGADMIGFVLVPWSPRAVDPDAARALRREVPDGILAVGVLVDADPDEAEALLEAADLDRVQVYGEHAIAVQERLTDRAIVARRTPEDPIDAGDPILLDRSFGDEPAATDLAAHWHLAGQVAREDRRVLLAGSLTPETVATAVQTARPWGVDVARGVERAPGIKDHARVEMFIRAVRGEADNG